MYFFLKFNLLYLQKKKNKRQLPQCDNLYLEDFLIMPGINFKI